MSDPTGNRSSGYVIIGNSAAGIAAAEAIREHDRRSPLTIIADEPHPAYGRPLTSYILGGKVTRDQLWIRPDGFYDDHGITKSFGRRVTAIDAAASRLVLDDDSSITYEKLLIATGGTPRRLPVPGADLEGVFYLRTLADSDAILAHLGKTRRVVLCGGGLVTAKAMDALRHVPSVEQMTMVEIMPAVLSQLIDGEPAEIMQQHYRANGVDVRVEMSIEEVLGESGSVSGVRLKSGEVIDCEMVIVGMGVIPNTGFLDGGGIETDFGIVTDNRMQTSIPGIYSAGDVAQVPDLINGGTRICAIWPAACEQGRVAGLNMAGRPSEYGGGIGMNSAEFFGLQIIAAGNTRGGEGMEVVERRTGQSVYRRLVTRDGRITGFIAIGDTAYAGVLTAMIRSRIDISGFADELLRGDLARFAAQRHQPAVRSSGGSGTPAVQAR
ncbi:MAG: NAD(P)/FAD-dependent oxidoreductase [Thermoleophilia bacterium]